MARLILADPADADTIVVPAAPAYLVFDTADNTFAIVIGGTTNTKNELDKLVLTPHGTVRPNRHILPLASGNTRPDYWFTTDGDYWEQTPTVITGTIDINMVTI